MLKILRYLLYPISLIYGGIVWLRNTLYDKKIIRSASFDIPLICVGNLVVGGTGKTPMIEYLIAMLNTHYKVATLSRGYGRKTKGFLIAGENATAKDLGDEPMQFHTKFPGITVAVAEQRIIGIPSILDQEPATGVILLDDAFQHREVNAGLNLLLTEYANIYTKDHMIPTGRLRDIKSSRKRAHIIIVTKCPAGLDRDERSRITGELMPTSMQKIFFTSLTYETAYHLFSGQKKEMTRKDKVLLVTGIAHPSLLKEHISQNAGEVILRAFPDHHSFSGNDVKFIADWLASNSSQSGILLTTEKDGMRLKGFKSILRDLPIYVMPIRHTFLFNDEARFQNEIFDYVRNFKSDQ